MRMIVAYFRNCQISMTEFFDKNIHNQKVVDNMRKLSKIGFSVECFTAYFLRVSNENVKIWLVGGRLGIPHKI